MDQLGIVSQIDWPRHRRGGDALTLSLVDRLALLERERPAFDPLRIGLVSIRAVAPDLDQLAGLFPKASSPPYEGERLGEGDPVLLHSLLWQQDGVPSPSLSRFGERGTD